MEKIKVAKLIVDFNLYPRARVNDVNIDDIVRSLEASGQLTPIIVEAGTNRIVDGAHRYHALIKLFGADATADVEYKTYGSEAELFSDAMRLNAEHGQKLSAFDKTHCLVRGEELGLTAVQIAACLSLTHDNIEALRLKKTAIDPQAKPVPIKRTLRHLAGGAVTKLQLAGNEKAGGKAQLYYVNQIINLFECDLLDRDNEILIERLTHLKELIKETL